METQILNLKEPYEYICCNGRVALHIATLIVYEAKVNEDGEYELETHSHPVVRNFSTPSGTVWNKAELRDCDILCREDNPQISLRKFRQILSRYPESYENVYEGKGESINPVWKKDLEDIGIKIAWPVGEDGQEHFKEFKVRLEVKPDKHCPYLCTDRWTEFFFYIEADDLDELKAQLIHKRDWYYYVFKEHDFAIRFTCDDKRYESLIKEVNDTKAEKY
ncbi:MAG: hypothetical protein IKP36_13015 [Bacteroidaceae bacterium]|nr:hypothetical protein [Bacteroidaceae bacterium]